MNDQVRFCVGAAYYKLIAWVCVLAFSFAAVMAWRDGEMGFSPMFLIFVALGAYMLINWSSLEVDSRGITVTAPFAAYQMMWDEIDRVEYGAMGTLVLYAPGNKRLACLPPEYWSGKDKSEMLKFMLAELDRRALVPKKSLTADYTSIQKNVRIPRIRDYGK